MAGDVDWRCAERAAGRDRRVDGRGEGGREIVEFGPEAVVYAAGVAAGQQAPPGEVPGLPPVFPDGRGLGGFDRISTLLAGPAAAGAVP
jgi:hypothetical protein